MHLFANIYFILHKRRIIYPKTIKLQFTENRIPHFYFQRLHPLCNIYAFNIYHPYCNIYCNISKLNLPRKRRKLAVFEIFAPRSPKPHAVSSSLTTPTRLKACNAAYIKRLQAFCFPKNRNIIYSIYNLSHLFSHIFIEFYFYCNIYCNILNTDY